MFLQHLNNYERKVNTIENTGNHLKIIIIMNKKCFRENKNNLKGIVQGAIHKAFKILK